MTNSVVNVLLVNDSTYMLKFLQDIINSDDGLHVVGTARDGIEALRRLSRLKPNVIVLVATIRALESHGNGYVEKCLCNLEKHI